MKVVGGILILLFSVATLGQGKFPPGEYFAHLSKISPTARALQEFSFLEQVCVLVYQDTSRSTINFLGGTSNLDKCFDAAKDYVGRYEVPNTLEAWEKYRAGLILYTCTVGITPPIKSPAPENGDLWGLRNSCFAYATLLALPWPPVGGKCAEKHIGKYDLQAQYSCFENEFKAFVEGTDKK